MLLTFSLFIVDSIWPWLIPFLINVWHVVGQWASTPRKLLMLDSEHPRSTMLPLVLSYCDKVSDSEHPHHANCWHWTVSIQGQLHYLVYCIVILRWTVSIHITQSDTGQWASRVKGLYLIACDIFTYCCDMLWYLLPVALKIWVIESITYPAEIHC